MLKNWICESIFLPFTKCYKILVYANCPVGDGKDTKRFWAKGR